LSLDVHCPNCQAEIGPADLVCGRCGADFALMLLAAEHGWAERGAAGDQASVPLSTEQLVPRLGDYLVQHGYVSQEQLQRALTEQAGAPEEASRRLIGQTLVDLGFLSSRDLDRAIARRLLDLQSALFEANRGLEVRVSERTAQLEAALARLTEYNQLKANFVANISHELRTPLTHIKGYNLLLLDQTLGPTTADQQEALKVTASSIARLEQLIDDLISYAAATRGELVLNLQPVSLRSLLPRVIERIEDKAERHSLRLTLALPEELPLVLADEEKLFWTLLQLLDNAVKFTPGGGQVTLAAEPVPSKVVLSVRDTGIGVPAGQLNDIFEPFRQLDGSSTRRYGGTGLGLALVRRIVEAHGARVEVASRENQGSTFSFALADCAGRSDT
jgi:signal transduction histidine kinase